MAVASVVDDDPESVLRRKIDRRTQALGVPVDPVTDPMPPTTTPAPPAAPAPTPVTRSPTVAPATPVTLSTPTYSTLAVRNDDEGATPAPPTTPPTPAPTLPPPPAPTQPVTTPNYDPRYPNQPGMPTGPVTSDNDPRLGDPRYGSAVDVLNWLNRPNNPNGPGGMLSQPANGDYKSLVWGLLAGKPVNQASLLGIESELAKYGIKIEKPNAAGERTKIILPDGRIFRLGYGEGSWQWIEQPPAGAGGGIAVPGGQGVFQDALRKIIMERLAAAQRPIDENDLNIKQPYDAARLEADRNATEARKELAERRAATGDTSGSLDTFIQQSRERMAVGLGGLKSKLIQDEYTARRNELLDLMQMAIASSDAQAARDIQAALVALDAAKFQINFNANAGG